MSEKIVGNIHMSTRRFGHDCTFTWRLRNLSLLKLETDTYVAKRDFTLHPKCDARWGIVVKSVVGGYEIIVCTQSPRVPKVVPPFYIGVYNRKGDLVLPFSPDKAGPEKSDKGDYVCMEMKMRLGEGNTVIIGDDKVVELEDDTLVICGRVVVPMCCTRNKIEKEETRAVPKTTELLDYFSLIKAGFEVA